MNTVKNYVEEFFEKKNKKRRTKMQDFQKHNMRKKSEIEINKNLFCCSDF